MSKQEKKKLSDHEKIHEGTWQFMAGKPRCPICGKPLKSVPMTKEDIENF